MCIRDRLAAVAPRIVNALNIHVHLRLIAVLVPHTLSLAVGREMCIRDSCITFVLIFRSFFIITETFICFCRFKAACSAKDVYKRQTLTILAEVIAAIPFTRIL